MAGSHPPAVPVPLAVVSAWSWRLLVTAATFALVGYLLLQLYVVVLPLALAGFAAAVLEPAVDRLRRHRWPSSVAA